MLTSPAAKLKMKPGDRKLPKINELTMVLNKVTISAGLNPYWNNMINEIIFANPNLKPGIGCGISVSEICKIDAVAISTGKSN